MDHRGPERLRKKLFLYRTDIEGWGGSVWIINPDLLTSQIEEREGLSLRNANLAAVERIEEWLYKSVEVYQTIGVETVLSSPKYRSLVERAQERGFEIRIIYIVLASADLQLERIRVRVAEGGHNVPPDKTVVRRQRSFEQLAWFAVRVDACYVYDNSTGEPQLLAEKMGLGWSFGNRSPATSDAHWTMPGSPFRIFLHTDGLEMALGHR